jgi:hypothetical protein
MLPMQPLRGPVSHRRGAVHAGSLLNTIKIQWAFPGEWVATSRKRIRALSTHDLNAYLRRNALCCSARKNGWKQAPDFLDVGIVDASAVLDMKLHREPPNQKARRGFPPGRTSSFSISR